MAGKGFRLRWQPTATTGAVSEVMDNTKWPQVVNGSVVLEQVIISSNVHRTFDFRIVSPTGNNTYVSKDNGDILNDHPDIVMRGEYTLVIENCAETPTSFEGEFLFRDLKDK